MKPPDRWALGGLPDDGRKASHSHTPVNPKIRLLLTPPVLLGASAPKRHHQGMGDLLKQYGEAVSGSAPVRRPRSRGPSLKYSRGKNGPILG